jgi:hypothetical protein
MIEWMTDDLMEKFGSNPIISSGMRNPKCLVALQLLQSNPKEAKTKFSHDVDVTLFLQEFGKLMSSHFVTLDQQQQASKVITNKNNVAPTAQIVDISNIDENMNNDIAQGNQIGPLHAEVLRNQNLNK